MTRTCEISCEITPSLYNTCWCTGVANVDKRRRISFSHVPEGLELPSGTRFSGKQWRGGEGGRGGGGGGGGGEGGGGGGRGGGGGEIETQTYVNDVISLPTPTNTHTHAQ